METGQTEETLAIDLKSTIDLLGGITGETASVDILDTIFNNFCIGK
jgi:tRNA modification GTPase